MREILFRGKRIDNGEWVFGFYVKSNIKGKLWSDEEDSEKHLIVPIDNRMIKSCRCGDSCKCSLDAIADTYEVDPETVAQRINDDEWYY